MKTGINVKIQLNWKEEESDKGIENNRESAKEDLKPRRDDG